MDKKELIRKCAIKVIAREGYHEAKIKTIADEAGIAAGTVYLYFKNKEDILDYIFIVEHKKRADFINELYRRNEPIEKVVDSFLEFHFNCFKNEPETAKVLYMELITIISLKKQTTKQYIEEVYKAFSNILKREQENNRINTDVDVDTLSSSIIYFLRIISYDVLLEGDIAKFERIKEYIKNIVLYGIVK